ncbi:hypothetical protein B0H13DRAFT_2285024 [Mycena leptocephala]|nr:hypothetical protein B0H13DRAFT_2285024 [Mycena leptocephala]
MAVSNPGINLILGPVIIGIIINTFIFGVVFTQAVTYYTSARHKKDSWAIKGLVSWALLLDTFHSCAVMSVLWAYCITHFGDVNYLRTTPWAYPTTPIFSARQVVPPLSGCYQWFLDCSASVPIQIFLAFRVKRLSNSWPIFCVLSTLSIASGIMAFISAIRAVQVSNIKDFAALIPVVDAWLALSVLCDLSLTTLLFVFLRRSRTGFAKTDNLITRLIIQSIETASFSTLNSIMDLITFTVLQNTNFHFIFALLSGRMYTNTLLATLNSRDKLRENMDMGGIHTSGGLHTTPAFMHSTAVHISVEQHQQGDMEMETKNSSQGKRSFDTFPTVSRSG